MSDVAATAAPPPKTEAPLQPQEEVGNSGKRKVDEITTSKPVGASLDEEDEEADEIDDTEDDDEGSEYEEEGSNLLGQLVQEEELQDDENDEEFSAPADVPEEDLPLPDDEEDEADLSKSTNEPTQDLSPRKKRKIA